MSKKSPQYIATISTIIATVVYAVIKYLFESNFSFRGYITFGWWDIPIFAVLFWIGVFVSKKYF